MKTLSHQPQRTTQRALERVIEPLASYICATDQPKVALISALTVLFNAMEETNKAAYAHAGTFSENQWS
jgi:hypothetical protein